MTDTDKKKLPFLTFLSMFLRSYMIQGSFSLKYRQNTGFLFCIMPVAKSLWKNKDDRRNFSLRHMEYYNGNPFMITLVIGAVAKLEEKMKNGEGITEKTIAGFKKAVGAATGSVGDRFFWSTLRPFGIIIGILSTYFFGIVGIIAVLAAFNIPCALLKWRWLRKGYSLGTEVIGEIQNKHLQMSERFIGKINAILLAMLTVFFIFVPSVSMLAHSITAFILFLFSLMLYHRNKTVSYVLALSLCFTVLSGILIAQF